MTLDTATLADGLRRFTLASTAPQREDGPHRRVIEERAGGPRVVTASPLFDALFAQAVDDARLDSVESIRDFAYNDDQPIPCACFQTGEKWTYVWTRDLSYALDLGLADFDPTRGATSLLFKTSGFRSGIAIPSELPGGSSQIIQDTGTGGSWPVSTDRVAWALGAEAVLVALDGPARTDFAKKTLAALRGTIAADRLAAFDPATGLYGGEHSFLDWREQTYAPWIVDHFELMAEGKALSTNVLHYRALRLAARLARKTGEASEAARYAGWADALARAIDRTFWDAQAGLYASLVTADPLPLRIGRYELLGNALAIEAGIASPERARRILASYPWAPFGPPVYWPEQPGGVPVYHNRAIWPFVTAHALRAAADTGDAAVANLAIASLMRGAALNLSNMENLEWLTGKAEYDGGPQVDSRRQLWSVGGYLGLVEQILFGWRPALDGAGVRPFLTGGVRRLLGGGDIARLEGLRWHGRMLTIMLHLPRQAADDAIYPVAGIALNARPFPERLADSDFQPMGNIIDVRFGAPRPGDGEITHVAPASSLSHDDPRIFAPDVPEITSVTRIGDAVRIAMRPPASQALTYRFYRDGREVARGGGAAGVDASPPAPALTACYAVVAEDRATGLRSHPSLPACLRGTAAQEIGASDPRIRASAGLTPESDGVSAATVRIGSGDSFEAKLTITRPGRYEIRFRYDNHRYLLNTGITNAVKRLTLTRAGDAAQTRIVQLPHVREIDGKHPLGTSTAARFELSPGTYRLTLDDFFNMSALAANARYRNAGGAGGPINEARIAAILIDAVEPPPAAE